MPQEVKDPQNAPVVNPEEAVAALGDAGQTSGQPEPFFRYRYLDGEEMSFATREELAKAWRESHMRQSDYTKKTQSLSEERKNWEKEREEWGSERKRQEELARKYVEWDQRLRDRPDIYQELERRLAQQPDPSVYAQQSKEYANEANKELAERLEALERRYEQENEERQLEALHGELAKKYPDYDRSRIDEGLSRLGDGSPQPLLETLYWASKGQQNPVEVEQRLAASAKQKQAAQLSSPGTNGTATKSPATLNEAHDAAMREFAGENFDE